MRILYSVHTRSVGHRVHILYEVNRFWTWVANKNELIKTVWINRIDLRFLGSKNIDIISLIQFAFWQTLFTQLTRLFYLSFERDFLLFSSFHHHRVDYKLRNTKVFDKFGDTHIKILSRDLPKIRRRKFFIFALYRESRLRNVYGTNMYQAPIHRTVYETSIKTKTGIELVTLYGVWVWVFVCVCECV